MVTDFYMLQVTPDHSIGLPGLAPMLMLTNNGSQTVYYKASPDVSAASNDGSIAAAASQVVAPPCWLRTATGVSPVTLADTPSGVGDLVWMAAALQNGWGNLGSSFSTAAYRKDGQGYVHLKGVITGGTATAGTVLLTLPVGYRPAENKIYPVAAGVAAPADVRVFAGTGQVQLQTWPAGSFLALESIPPLLAEQ